MNSFQWRSVRTTLVLAGLALLLAAVPAQGAERHIDGYVEGLVGGGGIGPGIAVYEGTDNAPTTDKVFSTGANRVQRYDYLGDFELMWGKDVVAGNGGTGAEVCTVAAECKPGVPGTLRGEFSNPEGIAIDQANGWIYVWVEGGGNFDPAMYVDKFDVNGNFLLRFGNQVNGTSGGDICPRPGFPADLCKEAVDGSGPGELGNKLQGSANSYLAVSPAAPHDVFVGDPVNRRVMQYQSNGTFIRAWGYDVAPGADPPAFETCTVGTGCQQGSTEEFGNNGQFSTGLTFVTVDSNGVVYVSDTEYPSRIIRFDSDQFAAPSAGLLPPITTSDAEPPGPLLPGQTEGMVADRLTNHLYVLRNPEIGDSVIQEIDPAALTVVSTSPAPGDVGQLGDVFSNDLALQLTTGNLYTVGTGHSEFTFPACGFEFCTGYFLLDAGGFTPQSVTIGSPTGVTSSAVVLHGTVSPNGFASYRFEYSKAGGDWIPAGEWKPVASLGSESISESISGLEPNSTYRVRLVTRKIYGATAMSDVISSEEEFATVAVAPGAETLPTSQRGINGATIYGRVNPNNLPTTYYFEYGESTAYGSRVPDGDAGSDFGERIVSAELTGLLAGTTYHYRVVAENDEGVTTGEDFSFTTRGATSGPARAWEMVTPPFKIVRTVVPLQSDVGENPNPGLPSKDGDAVAWSSSVFPMTDEARTGSDGDNRIIRRTSAGWVWQTRNTLPSKLKINGVLHEGMAPGLPKQDALASSGDLETLAWYVENGEIIQSEAPGVNDNNNFYTRRDGTGVEGFTPWVFDTRTQYYSAGPGYSIGDRALINDAGTAMVRWGGYWGLAEDPGTPEDDDPSDEQQLDGSGATIYLQQADDPDQMPAAPKDLVNECTSGGAGPTLIPARIGSGLSDDILGARACTEGTLVSPRGASVGAGSAVTAMSNDGRRVFFTSPEPSGVGVGSCTAETGAETNCPPQLYVRQYDALGENPVVRWISRPQDVGTQQIDELAGAYFQGASEDGRHVYFATATPLLTGDPNSGDSITLGAASQVSRDIYRYTFPDSLAADPAGGTLTRITAGPAGTGDPNASSNSQGGIEPIRYLSDDGRRAYFLTDSPISGADTTPPAGGVTLPADTLGTLEDRNLYLFDDEQAGASSYKFIARLETETTFRGTRDGGHVIFTSTDRLTSDDDDDATDIFLYDADKDELVRVSSPQPGAVPYGQGTESHNADLGKDLEGADFNHRGAAGELEAAGGWGRGRYYNVAEDANGIVSVFFQSRSELIPEDENGDHYDVYQWREGELSLVSPASPGHYSFYSGNSVDGQDVFIFTSERIDPREIDDYDYDIYDYRVGGGFPYTPPPAPCDVLGHACRGPASTAPASRVPDSLAGGAGNSARNKKHQKCRKGKVRKKGKCVPRKHRKAGSKARGGSK